MLYENTFLEEKKKRNYLRFMSDLGENKSDSGSQSE